ncbi:MULTISPECIES: ATP-dependent RNA helicase HrpA [unclassified Pseudonocardia]|uniref:ATP-dependent RNA helicase HrpA n=1 Tax=unclassified Pseudonocardia TaxID=2619320 RepID=UPI000964F152|nr:ATP-dependent RNA helicase HrpA [Pseudonocardia sp. Ae707_Ps1]OLM16200.1 ATP-dependent helicase hrpA [Pseudonocardia sp. Ae707_Ps1]
MSTDPAPSSSDRPESDRPDLGAGTTSRPRRSRRGPRRPAGERQHDIDQQTTTPDQAAAQAAPGTEGAARGRPARGQQRRPRRRGPRGRSAAVTAPGPDQPGRRGPDRDGPDPAGNGGRNEPPLPPLDDIELAALRERITELGPAEAERFGSRLDRARDGRAQQRVADAVQKAGNRVARRRAALPRVSYPATLPVSARREEIADAIRDNQVVIVAGETGSGKTTQLPKICLELGRGVHGMIGHTQPRRLAARTVAARIAEELGVELGGAVGWKVRFTDQVGDSTLVKLMTDGILLAELAGDKDLHQYDTLIIDEAHERSLNIDFILGYLTRLLPRRPDLKVIITSATIDPERFARHFGEADDPAPIVEVSGRTFPVEVRYRPVVDPDDPDADPDRELDDAIGDAVVELQREGPGDVLVFLPGEREIREAADALERRNLRNTEILPLYARLSTAEQQRVWQSHTGNRVVLATNVAETSLTVPGVRYVVDTGTARISRYSRRLKVQRLPIEKISQASANQRSGRCGRTSDGIAIRLYAEDDFDARPEFTDPEILRTNLASVVLQMIALDLGEISEFPFVEPPDRRAVADGLDLLHELGALRPDRRSLTAVGQSLSRLPVDPRLGRMLVEAHRNGCLREVLVIAAALSVQDPRERPTEQRQAADEKHRRFGVDGSDFLAFLRLWDHLDERRDALSGNRFRRELREDFLHYLRVREWWDLHGQLRQAARSAGMDLNERDPEWAAHADRIHRSVLAGLLSQVGMQDPLAEKKGKGDPKKERKGPKDYLGARGAKFAIWPGSGLAKKPPRWVMAAELVETTRLWARTVAPVQPDWIEPLAEHLVKRTYSEPRWSRNRGSAVATERVTLHGLPLVADRTVAYGRIDPEVSRDLFLRHALVEGDWETRHPFFHANRELLDDAEELEHRARRRDLVVDEDTLFAFYDARVPADVVSGKHFDRWWKAASRESPGLLDYTEELLATEAASQVDRGHYPDHLDAGGLTLPLSYAFEPGHHTDGVTVDVPVAALHQVDPTPFTWQVPGLREELVTALIRTLPRNLRRNFSPAPDHARAALRRLAGETDRPLLDGLERELGRMRNVEIRREDWELERLPEHLTVTFRVLDEAGAEIARDTDLERLRRELAPKVREELAAAGSGIEETGLTSWTIGELPRELPIRRGAHVVTGYPGLRDRGRSADVHVFATAPERDPAHHRGARRLLLLGTPNPGKQVQRGLDNRARLALSRNPHGSLDALLDDCTTAAADHLVGRGGGDPFDEAQFTRLAELLRMRLPATTLQVLDAVRGVLEAWHATGAKLTDLRGPATRDGAADVRAITDRLVAPGFVTAAGATRLGDVKRYLQACEVRLDKLHADPGRDARWTAEMAPVEAEYHGLLAGLPEHTEPSPALREIGWMIEELRVSLYAHPMRTRHPVSVQRVERAIDELPPPS